ncbi:MAG: hypothetical protein R3B07_34645 [Polyangiaceae bacterium]
MWRTYGEKQLEDGQKSQCGQMGEIVYNMAKAYQAGRLLAKSIQARLIFQPALRDEQDRPRTEGHLRDRRQLPGYRCVRQGSGLLREYAADPDTRASSPTRHSATPSCFAWDLVQEDQAIDDANKFNRYYRARKAEQAACRVAFAVAAYYAERRTGARLPSACREPCA